MARAALEETLAAAIAAVRAGLTVVPRDHGRQLVRPALSHRERQVLSLMAEGRTNGEIARAPASSPRARSSVTSRRPTASWASAAAAEAAALASELGLV